MFHQISNRVLAAKKSCPETFVSGQLLSPPCFPLDLEPELRSDLADAGTADGVGYDPEIDRILKV